MGSDTRGPDSLLSRLGVCGRIDGGRLNSLAKLPPPACPALAPMASAAGIRLAITGCATVVAGGDPLAETACGAEAICGADGVTPAGAKGAAPSFSDCKATSPTVASLAVSTSGPMPR